MAKDIKQKANKQIKTKLNQNIKKQAIAEESPKFKLSIITDFIIGFVLMWIILLIHANMTLTQFWRMISTTQVALTTSLIVSIILLVLYIIFAIFCIFVWKRPFIIIGSLVAFPLIYWLSETVREGFRIFFYFI